jgi:hypothetical protein
MKRFFLCFFLSCPVISSFAGEGLWIPLLLENRTISDMQSAGLRLSAEDIYSINKACLKDAVVMFGKGCTGELISPEGLLITNHHCGYGRIQAHSTVDKNYLTDGFWAGSRDQELPNPGLTVSFLVRIEDVTDNVLQGTSDDMTDKERAAIVDRNSAALIDSAIRGTHYDAEVESFFFGIDYYLFVYEVFSDIRLVGSPPSSIGAFGGETDNWVWPRHRGDFSLFRIYAGKNNEPSPYDSSNVPYKPKKFLAISTKGIRDGDFTMVMGYPAHTDEYLYSEGLEIIAHDILPAKIKMREERLRIMKEEMAKSPVLKLQYANKYEGTSNAWKKWKGVVEGIRRTGAIDEKKRQEKKLTDSISSGTAVSSYFTPVMQQLNDFYSRNKAGIIAADLGYEVLSSCELANFVSDFYTRTLPALYDTNGYALTKAKLRTLADNFNKTVSPDIDRKTMPCLLDIYCKSTDATYHPGIYNTIQDRFKGNAKDYVNRMFEKSIFTHPRKLDRFINNLSVHSAKRLLADPAICFYESFSDMLLAYYNTSDSLDFVVQHLYRDYLKGLMKFDTNRILYPDANFTMRISYGKIEGYQTADAIDYLYYTTTKGLLEKENPDVADYLLDGKLKKIIESKDFGSYAVDSVMPVCFVASNHTSGGNSGSPVLDAYGRLIGINFDRNWEGTISDYRFDPAVCRNISLDMRYVLFIIDKYAGATNIMRELILD